MSFDNDSQEKVVRLNMVRKSLPKTILSSQRHSSRSRKKNISISYPNSQNPSIQHGRPPTFTSPGHSSRSNQIFLLINMTAKVKQKGEKNSFQQDLKNAYVICWTTIRRQVSQLFSQSAKATESNVVCLNQSSIPKLSPVLRLEHFLHQ